MSAAVSLAAAADLAAAYHEAVFVTGAAFGRLTPGGAARDGAWVALIQFRRDRDSLTELAAASGWSLPDSAAAYQLPPLGDDGECAAAIGAAARAVTLAAGAWLASTSYYHDDALAYLRAAAGLGLGYETSVWVGWPG